MSRQMKDSGIEWIGEIPADWELGRIGQLYSERREKVSDTEYAPLSVTMQGIVPQLSTAAKTDAHDDRKLVKKGDFAINSRSDRRGSCGVSPFDGSVSLINTILCPHDDMNAGYYNWLFHTSMFADEYYKWGHGIVNDLWTTGWQEMKRISISVPAIEEQAVISNYLDEQCAHIDAVIEKTKASIEEYKKLKQAVITQAVTKGIRGDRPMKDSGIEWIGEIPADWDVLALKYLCSMQSGKNLTSEEIAPEGNFKVYGGNGVRGYYKDYNADGDYLLVGRQGALCGNVHHVNGKFWATEHAILTSTTHLSDINFLFYLLIGMNLNQYVSSTAAQPGLAVSNILNIRTCLVPISEQEEIACYLDAKCSEMDVLVAKKETFLAELETYKKSLIYEYVTGKKEVPQSCR
ncbi:MAG: restriction endonuclease subunit S [Lachnospiraceae bacterium]